MEISPAKTKNRKFFIPRSESLSVAVQLNDAGDIAMRYDCQAEMLHRVFFEQHNCKLAYVYRLAARTIRFER